MVFKSVLKGATKRLTATIIGLGVAAAAAAPASATIDPTHQFIVNGGFEQTTNGLGQLINQTTQVVGWTSNKEPGGANAYTFVMDVPTSTTTGVPGESILKLWTGGVNGGPTLSPSPTGGNFIGADGAYHVGKLTQQISGLIVGQTYQLTFNFAGAQEHGFDGVSTDGLQFGFNIEGANPLHQTAILTNQCHGFTGWQTQTYNFVATQATDTLYFLATGAPAGQPPFRCSTACR